MFLSRCVSIIFLKYFFFNFFFGRNICFVFQILPFDFAQRLHTMLKAQGLKAEFRAFDGGHSLAPDMFQAIASLLVDVVHFSK